ncbi:transposase zinc-binding domain-containing protein [bacterium]|nr:transposase zinc-binding domain-containing protein [bacterium]
MAFLRVYHPREPKKSPLWQILDKHYEQFERSYEEKFEKQYGFFRPVVRDVVHSYMKCGDLKEGFARVRCPNCAHEFLLQFSCKVRCFCPSCQAKRVIVFGHHLKENVFYPVPHRQYVFSIPIMLRIYFKHNRSLLTGLCQCAYKSLLTFLRKTVRLKAGIPGVVMAIHTFGEYPEKFHPHIHAIVTDGLFTDTGLFHVMKRVDLKPLEEFFWAEVFKFLKKEGKINDDLVNKLMGWKHSGFSVDNGVRKRGHKRGKRGQVFF